MHRRKNSFASEFLSSWRQLNQASIEFADLIRQLEYPAVLDRIRSPPISLYLVLLGLLDAIWTIAFRLPLHALRQLSALLPDPPLRPDSEGLDRDVRTLLAAVTDTSQYIVHWLWIPVSCLRIELKIAVYAVVVGLFLALAYVAMILGFFWLLFFVLGA